MGCGQSQVSGANAFYGDGDDPPSKPATPSPKVTKKNKKKKDKKKTDRSPSVASLFYGDGEDLPTPKPRRKDTVRHQAAAGDKASRQDDAQTKERKLMADMFYAKEPEAPRNDDWSKQTTHQRVKPKDNWFSEDDISNHNSKPTKGMSSKGISNAMSQMYDVPPDSDNKQDKEGEDQSFFSKMFSSKPEKPVRTGSSLFHDQ